MDTRRSPPETGSALFDCFDGLETLLGGVLTHIARDVELSRARTFAVEVSWFKGEDTLPTVKSHLYGPPDSMCVTVALNPDLSPRKPVHPRRQKQAAAFLSGRNLAMNMSEVFDPLLESFGGFLPNLLGALAILLVGWIVALVLRAGIRKALGLLQLDRRASEGTGRSLELENGVASIAYYVVLLLALLGFFNALQLEIVSGPVQSLMDAILAFLPRLVGAAVLAVVAWIVATVVRGLSRRALAATSIDSRLSAEESPASVSASLSNVFYALVILLFLPAILGSLQLEGLLSPVEGLVATILGVLPNLFAATVIGLVGWFVARIVRDLVTNLLAAAGFDAVGARAGMGADVKASRIVGLLAYVMTLVPALIAALNALKIDAIATPAMNMLDAILAAIPNVFAAVLILVLAWFVARLAADIVTSLLASAGVNQLPARIGMVESEGEGPELSRFAGRLVLFFAMLLASVEAANRLGFDQVSELVSVFTQFGGQVLLGSVIIAVGFAIATFARRGILRVSNGAAAGVANVVRFAVLGLVFAMGLRAMGVADDIVNLAFGLTLGAMAVAFALSFGLGGRAAAGVLADSWVRRMKLPGSGE